MEYIGGFAVKMASKKIKCEVCIEAIFKNHKQEQYQLVHAKDRGGLIHISPSVRAVCEMTELAVQKILKKHSDNLPLKNGMNEAITTSVLKNVLQKYEKCFCQLNEHSKDFSPTSNHKLITIKCLAACYAKIRMYHIGRSYSEKLDGEKVRKQLTKLIHFKNQ
jgi:hypothetical protein